MCAKGVVGECPREEVQTSAKPFGKSERETRTGRTPSIGESTLVSKDLQTNYRSQIQGNTATQKTGKGCPREHCHTEDRQGMSVTFIQIPPSKEVVIKQIKKSTLDNNSFLTDTDLS